MIQRLQSIFLLLASGAIASLFSPIMALGKLIHGQAAASSPLADGLFTVSDDKSLMGLAAVAAVVFFVAIFLFKNRSLQTTVTQIGNLLSGGLLAYGYFLFSKAVPSVTATSTDATTQATEIGYSFGIGAPILAMVLSLIAIRMIRKDEAIVRSADRLR
jgi:uncharacterized membrane protein YebE (DUF533 family)